MKKFALLCLVSSFAASAVAAEKLKDLETDRPDKTESTVTVDKGHSQLEVELASFTQSKTGPDLFSTGSFEIKYGVTDHLDVQVLFDPYVKELSGGSVDPRSQGFRDTTVRVKWNLAGDQEMTTGIALIPFVKLPTAQESLGNGKVEGGLLVPMKVMLPHDIELAFELGAAGVRNDDNTDTNVQVISSYSLGHKIVTDDLHAYLEFYSQSARKAEWVATVDTGFTYQLSENTQADAGVNVGVTEAADPWNPFVGYSIRF